MVTFRLNGKEVTVPQGWTVMQAAVQEKVKVPHFCWHPGLSVAGVCRFCMVQVEGARKLEVACNLPVREGMVVSTLSEEVQEAHKWALEFHLVNHPLDCPICDQAGECGLQDYYWEVGKYKSQMTRPKVLKPKAINVGSELVLDTERCILCSRCVRFEEEVTKTKGLGIFDRGDRAIVGTYGEEKISHNYQENLVDVCPVGAFTSKKFRFKQRVWFLTPRKAICPGCSTGCHIEVHGKPKIRRYFRIKPSACEEVNGFWMCDLGRRSFEHLNPEHRLAEAWLETAPGVRQAASSKEAIAQLAGKLQTVGAHEVALLVSAQQTNEEYEALFRYFIAEKGVKQVYLWREPTEDLTSFDGLLLRGDRNPNTAGLMASLEKYGVNKLGLKDETAACVAARPACLIAVSPEVPFTFPSLGQQWQALASLPFVSLWGLAYEATTVKGLHQLLPLKGFAEKKGSYTNARGQIGQLEEPFAAAVSEALDVTEVIAELRQAW